jgi:hypothetical protein
MFIRCDGSGKAKEDRVGEMHIGSWRCSSWRKDLMLESVRSVVEY